MYVNPSYPPGFGIRSVVTFQDSGTCMVNHNSESLMVFNGPSVCTTSLGAIVVKWGWIFGFEGDAVGGVVGAGIVRFLADGESIDWVHPDEHAMASTIRKQRNG